MATPNHHPHPTADVDGIRTAISRLMSAHRVPGLSIAVTSSTGLLHADALGWADIAGNRPATPATGYLWFSMSKIVTATAALRLADEGRLDLDAPVTAFVPTYKRRRGGPEPRIRQLLNHTAGAPNPLPLRWIQTAEQPDSHARQRIERLRDRARPSRAVGGPARYSNLGYLLLADVVAEAAAQPFEQYVRQAVLEPAGMSRTGYTHRRDVDHATGYLRVPRPLVPLLRAALPAGVVGERHGQHTALRRFRVEGAGYGGLIGDVRDAARLLRLHLADGVVDGQRILAADTARAMRTIAWPGTPFDFGLGWFRRSVDRDTRPGFVEHWGTGGGFRNVMRLYPELDLGIVVMANTTQPYNHEAVMRAVVRTFRQ
jgi:CubicO group peptidase (beta-lactamase class C family)